MRGPRDVVTMLISVSIALLLLGSVRWQYGNSIGDSGRVHTGCQTDLPTRDKQERQYRCRGNLPHSPATTTRSNRGFEPSPRVRLSKIVMRNPRSHYIPCTAAGIANQTRPYPIPPYAAAAESPPNTPHCAHILVKRCNNLQRYYDVQSGEVRIMPHYYYPPIFTMGNI